MAKIAIDLERALEHRARHGTAGGIAGRLLARGEGWTIQDLICTSGPGDRRFEEEHSGVAIAIVVAGTFQYRSASARELMTPGSLLLGYDGQGFECGHEHGRGDRCISFRYTIDAFERLAEEAGAARADRPFRASRLPPIRDLSPIITRACSGLLDGDAVSWEEVSVRLAADVVRVVGGVVPRASDVAPAALARVTRVVRAIEREAEGPLSLRHMAQEAGLSSYHFLRTFERLTGVTPHQYLRRVRLRRAAMRLAADPDKVIDIAFDSGFGDVSNFTRAFRSEFGVSPRQYRLRAGGL